MYASLENVAYRQAGFSLSAMCALVLWLKVDSWRSQEQFFVERDAALSFPSLESSVSTSTLSLTCVGVPMLMIILSSLIKYRCGLFFATDRMLGTENVDLRSGGRRRTYCALFDVLGFVQTVTVTMCAYNGGKCFVGRLRPNFFAECDYKGYRKP